MTEKKPGYSSNKVQGEFNMYPNENLSLNDSTENLVPKQNKFEILDIIILIKALRHKIFNYYINNHI